ncbi:MAG TPA: ABC transporter, partial [Alcanivorax sp.]|nr:ABC transporter [Alcanivorax sp.]
DLEAHTTRHFREALADDPRFVVPEVYGDYSTHNILCLSYEEGVHISDPSVVSLSQERRNFLGRAIMELCCREVFEWNKMQTDPNFGNYLMRVGDDGKDKIVLLDFGAIRDFDDEVLGPGREMIRAAWLHDSERLFGAMRALEFLDGEVPRRLLDDFAALCFEAIEALQDPDRFPPPKSVVNDKGEYLWGESNLPNRVMNRASRTALSVHFDVPPKEFIFLFRKLLGAYTFLHVIKAQVRGNTILEPFIHMREDEDRERVAQKINGQAADS